MNTTPRECLIPPTRRSYRPTIFFTITYPLNTSCVHFLRYFHRARCLYPLPTYLLKPNAHRHSPSLLRALCHHQRAPRSSFQFLELLLYTCQPVSAYSVQAKVRERERDFYCYLQNLHENKCEKSGITFIFGIRIADSQGEEFMMIELQRGFCDDPWAWMGLRSTAVRVLFVLYNDDCALLEKFRVLDTRGKEKPPCLTPWYDIVLGIVFTYCTYLHLSAYNCVCLSHSMYVTLPSFHCIANQPYRFIPSHLPLMLF